MELIIDGKHTTFAPLQIFCKQWNLPAEFGVNYFEPKDSAGLGSIKKAGDALAHMKQKILVSIPLTIPVVSLLSVSDILAKSYQYELQIANEHVGLRLHDVGFAVAGFQDVIQAVIYELVRLNHTYRGDLTKIGAEFNFVTVYHNWLNASVRPSSTVHTYTHNNKQFQVRIINHIYGRVGLAVDVDNEVYYVADKTLACPGENYMFDLCEAVAIRLCERLTN